MDAVGLRISAGGGGGGLSFRKHMDRKGRSDGLLRVW